MIFVRCHQCCHAWLVQGSLTEDLLSAPEWAESFPCPTPLCAGRAMRAGGLKEASRTSGVVSITVEDFYRGIMGLGNGASLDAVKKLLFESKVVVLDAESKNGRTIIKSLTFADGTKMHFGISQLGACIYNIEEVGSEIRTDTAAKSSNPHREEAGRNPEAVGDSIADEFRARRSATDTTAVEQPRTNPLSLVPTTGDVPASEPTSDGGITSDGESDSDAGDHPPVRM